ncbi:MAG: class I SAM-dependent methyltransferase [Candidatus Kapaibacterium sp.]
MIDRVGRRVMFDQVADEYDAVRPGYPTKLFEILARAAVLQKGMETLEIGCGTGQATKWLIQYGLNVTCIDPSENMLRIARQKFAEIEGVHFAQSTFENHTLRDESLDLIIAATSWHWVDPIVGYTKVVRGLKPKGKLSIIANLHPIPVAPFYARIQTVYEELVPEWGNLQTNKSTEDVMRQCKEEMEAIGAFTNIEKFEYQWKEIYSREQYQRLIGTYSDHRTLGQKRLTGLQEAIGKVIESEFDGRVERDYLSVAYVGTKG